MTPTLTYYRDQQGKWRWRLQAANGKTVADSAEGYERIAGAKNGFEAVTDAVDTGIIVKEDVARYAVKLGIQPGTGGGS